MNRDDWNAKYAESGLPWGIAPNRFVVAETGSLEPGRALDLACGEGRNAVWLAERGWTVTAIDFSQVAIERARTLAANRGVSIDFVVGDVLEVETEPGAFDLVLLAYLQLPPAERATVIDRAVLALDAGGTFLLVAHDLSNHEHGHGGPTNPAVLWTADEVTSALEARGLAIERSGVVLREVDGAPRPAIDTLVRARSESAAAAAPRRA